MNGRLGAGTLADVIAAILSEQNFTDFDVSEVSGDLAGYVQGEVAAARNLIAPLIEVFQIDVIEDGPVLRFRSRARASLPATRISTLVDVEGQPLWQETRGHDSDYATEAIVTFYDPLADYEQASVRSRRAPSSSNRILRYDLGAILPEEAALAAAENLLRDNRISRRSLTLALPPTDIGVQSGDVLSIADGPEGRFLVTRIEDGLSRRIEAREFAPLTGGSAVTATTSRQSGGTVSDIFAPLVELMDLPQFSTGDAAGFARVAVYAKPWRTVAISASATSEGYSGRAVLARPAQIGSLAEALTARATGRFDWSQSIVVDLPYGGLSSAVELSVLNGANRLSILCANGGWEIVCFLQANEIAPGRWQLQGLLRGLAGTEDAMSSGASVGAPFVMLDDAVQPLGLAAEEMGLQLNWIAEAAGVGGMAGPFVFQGGLRAQTPLSPVHITCVRGSDGSVRVNWIRRARVDSDSWISADIPLDEPWERYRVQVLKGETVMRQVDVAEAAWQYAAADELSDFGKEQTQLKIRITQMGQRVPLGIPALALVTF